jgi:hypothetical protein
MKYRKGDGLTYNQKIMMIAKEMINIETGITYFDDDGNRTAKPKPGHNTYVLDDVSYEVHPNIGVVYAFDKVDNLTIACINNACDTLFEDETIVGRSSGSAGTTQYLYVSDDSKEPRNTKYLSTAISTYPRSHNNSFVWFIYTNLSSINNGSSLYVPFFNSATVPQETQLLSLSTIILDCDHFLILEDKYISPDLPSIHMYQRFVSGYIYDRLIRVGQQTGIREEIASNFLKLTKGHASAKILHNIFWIDWDDVDANHLIECGLNWDEQVKRQALKKYDKEELDTRSIANKKNYRCILTGVPIYEDCYVLDIYEQEVIQSVNVKDLEDVITNGGILYNTSKVVEINTKKSSKFKTDVETSGHKKIVKNKKINCVDGTDINKLKGRTVSKKKRSAKIDQFVDVIVTVRYDNPMHVLMSPYGMHCYMKITGSEHFENMTKSNVIIYRSFCPRLAVDVINSIDASDIYKKILNAANIKITYEKGYRSHQPMYTFNSPDNSTINVYKHINMSDILDSYTDNYTVMLHTE